MSTTEGVGGPCPLCGEKNCYVRTGTGTWFTFIACPDCLFAYAENSDSRGQGGYGQISGADVWGSVIHHPQFDTVSEFFDDLRNADHHDMENPFDFGEVPDDQLRLWRIDRDTLHEIYEGAPEIYRKKNVKVVESVDDEAWTWSDTEQEPTDSDIITDNPDTVEINEYELNTLLGVAKTHLHLYEGEHKDQVETAAISARQKLELED